MPRYYALGALSSKLPCCLHLSSAVLNMCIPFLGQCSFSVSLEGDLSRQAYSPRRLDAPHQMFSRHAATQKPAKLATSDQGWPYYGCPAARTSASQFHPQACIFQLFQLFILGWGWLLPFPVAPDHFQPPPSCPLLPHLQVIRPGGVKRRRVTETKRKAAKHQTWSQLFLFPPFFSTNCYCLYKCGTRPPRFYKHGPANSSAEWPERARATMESHGL